MNNCSSVTNTTTCACTTDDNITACDCPYGIINAQCVQYTGDDLDTLGVVSGDYLDDILIQISTFAFSESPFTAYTSDSIVGTPGGTNGHAPTYTVKLNPSADNAITVSSLGLFVDSNSVGDGLVKVDSTDTKDYLINQLSPATDSNGIVTLTPTAIAGVVYMVPSIDITKLLNYISENHHDLLCSLVQDCVPLETTTTTTTTSTSSTSTTSSTTTTTTAAPENTFDIINNGGVSGAFSIFFTDSFSSIDYVVDTTTGNGQTASYTYTGTTNDSRVTIQHSPTVSVEVIVNVDGTDVYDAVSSVGSVTIIGLTPQSDITVTIVEVATTTSTTTTSSSTTTTTTSGTTTTSTSTTTTTTLSWEVKITNTLGATSITNVSGIPGFTPSPALPCDPGDDCRGFHNAFTGAIQVTIDGPPAINGHVALVRDNTLLQFANLLTSDSYPKVVTFSSFTYSATALIEIQGNNGTL